MWYYVVLPLRQEADKERDVAFATPALRAGRRPSEKRQKWSLYCVKAKFIWMRPTRRAMFPSSLSTEQGVTGNKLLPGPSGAEEVAYVSLHAQLGIRDALFGHIRIIASPDA